MNSVTIPSPDARAAAEAQARWDSIAKPLGSLGLLEENIIKIAALTGSADVHIDKRCCLMFCADNGVVAEGVTQTDSGVTLLVAESVARGSGNICIMARAAHADVTVIDAGMNERAKNPNVLDRRIAPGTKNIAAGPAMTREQAEKAIELGIELVHEHMQRGYDILATGEMGIGNTTTSSALVSVLLGVPVENVTGRGAGLCDDGLIRKISAIKCAIEVNAPRADDPLGVLSKLGGFDIAQMAGVFIGGAIYRVPVIIDGFISAAAALIAERLCPGSKCAMIASHVSAEPAAEMLLRSLDLHPLITAGMRLGEGTGAVCALPLLDIAIAEYNSAASFGNIGMDAYTPQGEVC